MRRFSRYRGVGLIEMALAVVIVGVGTVAIMEFLTTVSHTNIELNERTTAVDLANSAMEMATEQEFTVIEEWLTKPPSFPSDTQAYLANASQPGLEQQGWKQVFSAQRVCLADLQQPSTDPADSCVRVTVTVTKTDPVTKTDKAYCTASRWFTKMP